MDEPESRVAIVTGASAGIGVSIATELGRLGWTVAVGARRTERLEDTAAQVAAVGGEPFAHALDVSDASSIEGFFRAVEAECGPVDVLVNNAGIAVPGWLHDLPVDALQREVHTNLLGPILLSRLTIASLRARAARGHVVFITSDATRHARPRMATYTATKAGIEALSHSLSMELEGSGIRSTVVRVGPTISEFGFGWPMEEIEDLMGYWPRFGLQRHAGYLDPTQVARAVVTAVTAPVGVVIDTIEVQPEAPMGDDEPALGIEHPEGRV